MDQRLYGSYYYDMWIRLISHNKYWKNCTRDTRNMVMCLFWEITSSPLFVWISSQTNSTTLILSKQERQRLRFSLPQQKPHGYHALNSAFSSFTLTKENINYIPPKYLKRCVCVCVTCGAWVGGYICAHVCVCSRTRLCAKHFRALLKYLGV